MTFDSRLRTRNCARKRLQAATGDNFPHLDSLAHIIIFKVFNKTRYDTCDLFIQSYAQVLNMHTRLLHLIASYYPNQITLCFSSQFIIDSRATLLLNSFYQIERISMEGGKNDDRSKIIKNAGRNA